MSTPTDALIGSIAKSVDSLITVDFGYGVIQVLNDAAHRRYGRVPALVAAEQLRARSELQAQSQQVASELRAQYVVAQQTSELLRIHRDGLFQRLFA